MAWFNGRNINSGIFHGRSIDLNRMIAGYSPSERPTVYGWHVDPSISDPAQAVTYLADAVGKTPAAMGTSTFSYGDWADAFFMPKPCMLRYDGTVAYYLDPNDYTKKADGTASDVANASFSGNAMMEWPLIWYKFEAGSADGEGYFYCSDLQVDSSYKCWCNIDANGIIVPHFYTAIYNGTGESKLRSLSGAGLIGVSAKTLSDRAALNNVSSDHEWDISLISDRLLINALLVLMGKTLAMQTAYGYGNGSSTMSSIRTGAMNNKGLFWGSISTQNSGVKVFGMENWWGTQWEYNLGMVFSGDRMLSKLTYGKSDGSDTVGYNCTGIGYNDVGPVPDNSDRINAMIFTPLGTYPVKIRQWNDPDSSTAPLYYGAYLFRATAQLELECGNYWTIDNKIVKPDAAFPNDRARMVKGGYRHERPASFVMLSHKQNVQLTLYATDDSASRLSPETGWNDSPWEFDMSRYTDSNYFIVWVAVRNSDNSNFQTQEDTGRYVTIKQNAPRLLAFGGSMIDGEKGSAYSSITSPSDVDNIYNSSRLSCKPVAHQ